MKLNFILPTSETFWEFSDFPIPYSGKPPQTIEEIISEYFFWMPYGYSNLGDTQRIFEEYPGILLLANELIVTKQQLERDTDYQHEQFFLSIFTCLETSLRERMHLSL